jgi:uncharacterized protein YecA (UPF0149 family)
MGAIAEAMVAYAQPLLDDTDGSAEQMQSAFTLAQVCWNLALLPEEDRDDSLAEMRATLNMDDGQFDEFRRSVVLPMILRHHEMFPHMPRLGSMHHPEKPLPPETPPTTAARTEKYPGTGRNAPCPCNSGRKYKRCCGR